ncbi:MAG: class I SAM-dependent methyltransferase [Planctomycetaceae bacterium]|nr:class I SAM-dependent methyltransferase [Planctomycetales bacterium]MCB9923096.1 class I SAM-dependent methyltransferase [Planctomycetaceae bacterium]
MLDRAITDYVASAPHFVKEIPGQLSDRELRFLALMGACPLAAGEILSIGCGMGQAAIVFAKAARLAGEMRVSAIDPLETKFYRTNLTAIEGNFQKAGVSDIIDFHHVFPEEISDIWDRPLRLLWLGCEHSPEGAETDFDEYCEHLTDGGIVAFQNAVKRRDGGLVVFTEDVLLDEHFGAAGVCGSVAWARYHKDPDVARKFRDQKSTLYQCLTPLIPFVADGQKRSWWSRLSLKLHERRIPHQEFEPESWLRNVA